MELYDGGATPNPRRVRIFLAEKGITVPLVPVDLGKGEHLGEAFRAINPFPRVPALRLDDGSVLTESIAICRYFERLHPEPALFGTGARAEAEIEMWTRRLEFELYETVRAVFRHLHPAMAPLEKPQIAAWGEANKPRVMAALAVIDQALADREFIAAGQFSVADITGLVALDMMRWARLTIPEELGHVRRWHAALKARPSAAA